jgi:hypothetical protein
MVGPKREPIERERKEGRASVRGSGFAKVDGEDPWTAIDAGGPSLLLARCEAVSCDEIGWERSKSGGERIGRTTRQNDGIEGGEDMTLGNEQRAAKGQHRVTEQRSERDRSGHELIEVRGTTGRVSNLAKNFLSLPNSSLF